MGAGSGVVKSPSARRGGAEITGLGDSQGVTFGREGLSGDAGASA